MSVTQTWTTRSLSAFPRRAPRAWCRKSVILRSLASTTVDQVGPKRAETTKTLLAYAASDTARFRADPAEEPGVAARQRELHAPLLEWLVFTCVVVSTGGGTDSMFWRRFLDARRGTASSWMRVEGQPSPRSMLSKFGVP